jgi:hypothetical protein
MRVPLTAKAFQICIKADISGSLRYLLITLKPLRGPSVGVQPPTDAEKSDKVKPFLNMYPYT